MKKCRLPRKIKKQIPKGMYCYTATSGFKELDCGKYGYTIKPCTFYSAGTCRLLDCEIEDQCKSCGTILDF